MHLLTVVGARPQFIKAAVVSRAIAAAPDLGLTEKIVHTGQHFDREMSEVFFEELDIPHPVINLGVAGGRHGESTGRMLEGLEAIMLDLRPDLVLVYGDTNTTLAGALAAAKLHIPVAHVEAGLRSFNRRMPEEINRVLTDHLAALLFCPSQVSRQNLASEGITRQTHIVGDVMYDAVLHYRRKAPRQRGDTFAAATVHRAENTDDPVRLAGILEGLGRIPVPVVLPLHPRTQKAIATAGIPIPESVEITPPASYLEMIGLVEAAVFVLTDSGGLQKEAFFLGRKCLTLRDETEWTELVDCGANRLVGADPDRIVAATAWALQGPPPSGTPYGDGHAGEKICEILAGSQHRAGAA